MRLKASQACLLPPLAVIVPGVKSSLGSSLGQRRPMALMSRSYRCQFELVGIFTQQHCTMLWI